MFPDVPKPSQPIFFLPDYPPNSVLYTLSLHDALPISLQRFDRVMNQSRAVISCGHFHTRKWPQDMTALRSEEHTSELQSRQYLVCRLLLEKKKNAALHIA